MAARYLLAHHRRLGAALVTAILAFAGFGTITPGGVVSAHAGLESTTPADGEIATGPLTEIRIRFTAPTTIAEEGFEVLRSDGAPMVPIQINTDDGIEYVLIYNPGLATGTYGVRWSVVSADGHPLSGSFQFMVDVPPTTTIPPTTTDPDATTIPGATEPGTTAPPTTVAVTTTTAVVDGSIPATSAASTTTPTTAPEFGELLADDTQTNLAILRIGHLFRFFGTIFGIGAIGALLWVLQSDKHDLFVVLNTVRMCGLVVALGAAMEWAAFQEATGDGIGSLFETRAGVSAILCSLGGVLMLFGLTERRSLEPVSGSFRWRPGATSTAGLIGAVAVLASFGFDGRAPARGPDILLAAADVAHVAVASVWAGGVAAMALVAWLRRRRGQLARVSHAVVRFSPIAALTLLVVALTGVLMSVMIVDDLGSPVSSPWGRTMMVKLVLVAMAVVAGGFNRFSLLPAINADPDSVDTARRVRFALTVESSILAVVIAVTAVLVTLSTAPDL